ncbi:MAG: superoxide dismutase [Saprospiraceae bacterium]|nr:superoxide dismutase [Saprospiraceae bacterium]
MKRRSFIKNSVIVGGFTALNNDIIFASKKAETDEFVLPKLAFSYDALEPFIDKMTMEIHHTKHHQAYVNNLNKALANITKSWKNLDDICKNKELLSTDAIRNNAGGHYNHSLFWELLKPQPSTMPENKLIDAINTTFGSLEKMKAEFNDNATKRFGSGWAWLVKNEKGELKIGSTPNQDNPLMPMSSIQGQPILALDVWEHAYYLKYQNKRKDYIDAWWNIVNWEKANQLFVS